MRKKWYVLLVLVLFFVQGIALQAADKAKPPKKVLKLMKKADKAIKAQKFEKVQGYFEEALKLAPEFGPLYLEISKFKKGSDNTVEEAANLDKVLQYEPANEQYKQYAAQRFFAMAIGATKLKNLDQANAYYSKLLAIEGIATLDQKRYVESLFRVGANYEALRKLQKSNEAFLKVLAISGLEATEKVLVFQTLYKVGLNYYNLKKHEESLTHFEKVTAFPEAETLNPQIYTTSYYLAGLNASTIKEFATSKKFLSKFVTLPGASAQLLPLANFLMGSNDMAMLDKEVEAVKADKKEKKKKEKISKLAEKYADILKYFSAAIEKNPGIEPAYMHMGNYYYYQNNIPKAIETYDILISKFPNSPDLAGYKRFLEDIKKSAEAAKKGKKKRKK